MFNSLSHVKNRTKPIDLSLWWTMDPHHKFCYHKNIQKIIECTFIRACKTKQKNGSILELWVGVSFVFFLIVPELELVFALIIVICCYISSQARTKSQQHYTIVDNLNRVQKYFNRVLNDSLSLLMTIVTD